MKSTVALLLASLAAGMCIGNKNVLLIIADDLRLDLNVYAEAGYRTNNVNTIFVTPKLDALAADSLLLTHAFVQFPLCGPSRASFLTGRFPDTIKVHRLAHDFRLANPTIKTLPDVFRDAGYSTHGMGKIFHDDSYEVNYGRSWTDFTTKNDPWSGHADSWHAVTDAEQKAKPLVDDKIKDAALAKLTSLSAAALSGAGNFFLAVGFNKPHLPFVFPDEFLNDYPVDVELPPNSDVPVNFPEIAWRKCLPLCDADDIKATGIDCDDYASSSMPDSKTRELRRAYYASVTYIDSLVGEVLQRLDDLDLENDTIVVFMSDHGFHLGEHNAWCKSTNYDDSVRIPLMLRIPGLTDGGILSNKLVEAVDIMPTIVEAAGLPALGACPSTGSINMDLCREGDSLLPLTADPDLASWKDKAFSQVWRNGNNIANAWTKTMGYSVRTEEYRYNHYVKFNTNQWHPQWTNQVSNVAAGLAELYNMTADLYHERNLIEPGQSAAIDSVQSTHYGYLTTKFPK